MNSFSISDADRRCGDESRTALNLIFAYADRLTHEIAMRVCARLARQLDLEFCPTAGISYESAAAALPCGNGRPRSKSWSVFVNECGGV